MNEDSPFNKLVVDTTVPSFQSFYQQEEKDLNNFSFWYPKVEAAGLFKTPKTRIIQLPPDIAELVLDYYEPASRQPSPDYREKTKAYFDKLQDEVVKEFGYRVFLKNAKFSNKFDFNNSCCCLLDRENALLSSLVNINYAGMCFDALGFTEIIIRELLETNPDRIPTIYNGMPLRPEYRAFYDFDQKKLLYIQDYWDYEYVRKGLTTATDRIVFRHDHKKRRRVWERHLKAVEQECEKLDAVEGLSGIWSVDFLVHSRATSGCKIGNNAGIYLIDMAIGCQSAYWDPVKAGVIEAATITQLPDNTTGDNK